MVYYNYKRKCKLSDHIINNKTDPYLDQFDNERFH